MNASKENCSRAMSYLYDAVEVGDDCVELTEEQNDFIIQFLEAAFKKLPKEASFTKDKKRCRAATTSTSKSKK